MVTRIHITIYVIIVIVLWVIVSWIQGVNAISIKFFKPLGTVIALLTLLASLFIRYAWSWSVFRGWFVERPDIRGTWKVELKSSWIDPETGVQTPPITGYATIRQTLTKLSIRIMTKDSRSLLIAHSFEQELDGLVRLNAIYRNEPKIELQGGRCDIHHGSFTLNIYGKPISKLEGYYWTDRGTKGGMILSDQISELYDTYEEAASADNIV